MRRLVRAWRLSLLAAAGAVVPCTSHSAPPKYPVLSADVRPTSTTIGEPVKLTVSIVAPQLEAVRIAEPFRPDDPASTWSLVKREPLPDDKLPSGEMRRRIEYTLAAFRTGDLPLPTYRVGYSPAGGPTTTSTLPQLSVHIESVLPAQAAEVKPNDIKPPVRIPYPRWIPVAAVLIALAVLALLLRGYWAILRRRVRSVINPPKRLDAWALEELSALEKERLIEQKRTREFYTRLADVVRSYVGRLYGINALDLTTTELLWRLEDDTEAPAEVRQQVKAVLDEADLVKFAKASPEPHLCRRSLESGREIVSATRYLLEPKPEAEEAAQGGKPAAATAVSFGKPPARSASPSRASSRGEV